MKLYTHMNVDLDNASTSALLLLWNKDYSIDDINFVPASWEPEGELSSNEMAFDIFAGGHGLKGKTIQMAGRQGIGSAFTLILEDHINNKLYTKAFRHFAEFLDSLEATGNWNDYYDAAGYKIPSSFPTIHQAFFALKHKYKKDDKMIVSRWKDIMEGMLLKEESRDRAKKEVKNARWFTDNIAYIKNTKEPFTSFMLFNKGAEYVIYEKTSNNTLGVRRTPKSTKHLGKHLEPHLPKWFHHPSGFLSCWGTDKAPQETPPEIDAKYLAELVEIIK